MIQLLENVRRSIVTYLIQKYVRPGSVIYTDEYVNPPVRVGLLPRQNLGMRGISLLAELYMQE